MKAADLNGNHKRKAKLAAGGHVTNPKGPGLDKHSTVVRTEHVSTAITCATVNNQKMLMGDIKSAYVQAYTKEKVFGIAVAGPE